MSLQEKSIKIKMVKIPLMDVLGIKPLLYQFRIPTRSDLQRIDELIATCDSVEKTRMGIIENFKTEKGIDNDVQINEYHIYYPELFKTVMEAKAELQPNSIAKFTKEEFDVAIEGIGFNYGQVKLLEKYLVKVKAD